MRNGVSADLIAVTMTGPGSRKMAWRWRLAFSMAWFGFFWAELPLAAQTTLEITGARITDGEIALSWKGNAKAHEIEAAYELPNWSSLLFTTGTVASIPLTSLPRFFRVRSLEDDAILAFEGEERRITLEAIRQMVEDLPAGDPPETSNPKIAEYLIGIPQLQDVTISDDCVWATFPDGRVLTIINNRQLYSDEEVAASLRTADAAPAPTQVRDNEPERRRARAATSPDSPTGIPQSNKAYVLTSRLTDFRLSGDLASMLKDNGYAVGHHDATLAALQNVSNAGVFYFEGHSAVHDELNRFIMVSDNTIHDPIAREFQKDIGYAIVAPLRRGKIHYSITGEFVTKYMTFSGNSFVFLNSCSSVWGASFFNTTFAGWDRNSEGKGAWRTGYYLFDRLLGANKRVFALQAADLFEFPPQRSFNYPPILEAMAKHSPFPLHVSTPLGKPEATLRFTDSKGFGILAPSIQTMSVDEVREELHITGIFDPQAPTDVTLNGHTHLAVISVAKSSIVCGLPARERPSAGKIRVSQRGHKSNEVPLTEWWIKATLIKHFAIGQPQPSATTEAHLHFRADVHQSRRFPGDKPAFNGHLTTIARDSTARVVSASGVYHYPEDQGTVEWRLAQPAEIPFSDIRGMLSIGGDGTIALTAGAFAGSKMTVIETLDGQPHTYLSEPGTRSFPPGMGRMNLGSYVIEGGKGPAAGDSGEFRWESASPESPPTGDFAR
jgi:hypothetical protein